MPKDPARAVELTRLAAGCEVRTEEVAVEEPLDIRIAGDTVAITMRTPGHDRELVLGFLWAEGIVSDVGEVSAIAHCGRPGDEGYGNTIEVTLAPGVRFDPDQGVRRGTVTTSACGICGRRSIDDLLARMSRLEAHEPIASAAIALAVRTLRDHQPLFARTGGCHAASLATHDGEHVATFEDVGRHNAVDKLVGARLLAGALAREAGRCMLVVSGRTSFEIVQKAFGARVPVVAGISAPSSLAVDLARRVGITLLGFVRTPSDGDGSMNVYAGADRVT